MTGRRATPRIGVIAGEESGQLLASGLVDALAARWGVRPELTGVGGAGLEARGLKSLFDPHEIALMGFTDVALALPRLVRRIGQTAAALTAARPDCIILVDSPDFSLRVARRVKARLPDVPIVKYVSPTVWAWRPGRAPSMARYVDQILSVLPFEPAVMERLGGPRTDYVGHRLMADDGLTDSWHAHAARKGESGGDGRLNVLVLPGSRRSEVRALLADFGKTLAVLAGRGHLLSVSLPTLPHLEQMVRGRLADWPGQVPVTVTTGRKAQMAAFLNADAALAASGTVTLELALAGIPAISCYRTDALFRMLAPHITSTWSFALPNIIADRPVINEYYDHLIHPGMLARMIEELSDRAGVRHAMTMDGYGEVRRRMEIGRPPAEEAARIVAELLDRKLGAQRLEIGT